MKKYTVMNGSLKDRIEASFLRRDLLEEEERLDKYIGLYKDLIKKAPKNKRKEAENMYKPYISEHKNRKKGILKQVAGLDKKWGVCIKPLTDYEEDAMWMSYRYAVGRHTIASHYHTKGIFENCYGRLSRERMSFIAFDINREIENRMVWGCNGPSFHFQLTNHNEVYKPAIDAYCEFVDMEDIRTYDQLQSYEKVTVNYKRIANADGTISVETVITPKKKEDGYEKDKYFTISNIEDLFVWNDLVHIFDWEKHKKCKLKDGSIVEYFWSWSTEYKENEDGTRQEVCYKKIRKPLYDWNPVTTTWIPDESIIEDDIKE